MVCKLNCGVSKQEYEFEKYFETLANRPSLGAIASPSGRGAQYEMFSGQRFFLFIWTIILCVFQNNMHLLLSIFVDS